MKTPWGKSDGETKIAPGIAAYTTPSHGGLRLSAEWNARVPLEWRKAGHRDGRDAWGGRNGQTLPLLGWYEEDCDWCMVALTFPEYFEAQQAAAQQTFDRWIRPKLLAAPAVAPSKHIVEAAPVAHDVLGSALDAADLLDKHPIEWDAVVEWAQEWQPPEPSPAPLPRYATREEWLQAAVRVMRGWIEEATGEIRALGGDAETVAAVIRLPDTVRVSVGFTSNGARSATLAECWHGAASADGFCQIHIAPSAPTPQGKNSYLTSLLHELVHAALPPGVGHKGPFVTLAKVLGFLPPWTATPESLTLLSRVATLADELGTFPHGQLKIGNNKFGMFLPAGGTAETGIINEHGKPKQSARLLKCECPECGYTARVTRKWIEEVTPPLCPTHKIPMKAYFPEAQT